jgi:hypothetical protein
MKEISIDDYHYGVVLHNGGVECTSKVLKLETDKSIIWLVNPNEDPINIYDLESLDNKKKFVHQIDGTWSCLIRDKKSKNFRAISSINNELPWYFAKKEPFTISNNIFLIIRELKSYEINYNAIASYLGFDHTFSGETFLEEVSKVYGGDIVYMANGNIEVISDDLDKWLGFDESINDSQILQEIFVSEVEKSLKDPYPEIQLTSGSDSRIILAAALLLKKKFSLMTGTSASVNRRDVVVSKAIAKKLNLKHKTIDASKRKIKDPNNIFYRITIETNAEFIPRNYIIFYKEYVLVHKSYKGIGRLKGYGGEIFKGFYKNVDRTIMNKTALLNQQYSDSVREFVKNVYNRYIEINKDSAPNIFYQRERSHFWTGANTRATLSYCKVYNPIQSPNLLAAGYRFQGGIGNSNLHKNMLSTLPVSIQKLPINYSKFEKIVRYILSKKVKSVVDYNYFLRPENLKAGINYDLLDQVISKSKIDSMIELYSVKGFYDTLLHKAFAVSNFFRIVNS